MKSLLIYFVMLMCTLTFAQTKKLDIDNVKVSINKNVVSVNISPYKGKLVVKYFSVDSDQVLIEGEYINMKNFSEIHTLPKGKYVIEVTKDNVKTTKTFEVKG